MSWETPYGQLPIRRRRKIRGPVTLVVLIVFLSGAAWYGWENVLNVPQPRVKLECTTPSPGSKQRISAEEVLVNVYNAGDVSGLAEETADALKQRGFRIGEVTNAPDASKVRNVELQGRAAEAPEVKLLAAQVAGEREPKEDGRKGVSVDLVLGDKFRGLQAKAPSTMYVESDVPKCQTKTVTPSP